MRWTKIRVLHDTSLFDSMQLQLRPILTVGMRCWAQWAKENLYSFPTLIRDHRFGIVMVGGHIEFERPHGFFSADEFEVMARAEVVQDHRIIVGHMAFMHGDERFLTLRILCRPVTMMGSDGSFAALPAKLEGHILDKFLPEEVTNRKLSREVAERLAALDPSHQIAEAIKPERLHRHDCEAADQWSFIEIGSHATTAREAMINDAPKELRPRLQPGLSTPVRNIDIEIKRPLFLFDKLQIRTQAYLHEEHLTFVHTFQSQMGGRHEHAVVVERF